MGGKDGTRRTDPERGKNGTGGREEVGYDIGVGVGPRGVGRRRDVEGDRLSIREGKCRRWEELPGGG